MVDNDDELTCELLAVLMDWSADTHERIRTELASSDLTESLAVALWALDPSTAAVPMRELAQRWRCDPSNVTLTINKLEDAGMVRRTRHHSDGRAKVIQLTPLGVRTRVAMLRSVAAASPLSRLDKDTQRHLIEVLGDNVPALK